MEQRLAGREAAAGHHAPVADGIATRARIEVEVDRCEL